MNRPTEFGKLLGGKIRSVRTAHGMSQEELAFKSSISAAHLGQIERAVKNPTIDTIGKIACALDISLAELFTLELPAANGERPTVVNKILATLTAMSESQQRDILKLIRIFKHYRDEDE